MESSLNTTKVSAVVPVSLTAEQNAALKNKVARIVNSENFDLYVIVDPSILGGLKLYIGSNIIDLSGEGALQEISIQN